MIDSVKGKWRMSSVTIGVGKGQKHLRVSMIASHPTKEMRFVTYAYEDNPDDWDDEDFQRILNEFSEWVVHRLPTVEFPMETED